MTAVVKRAAAIKPRSPRSGWVVCSHAERGNEGLAYAARGGVGSFLPCS
jgi:hypothetical protein